MVRKRIIIEGIVQGVGFRPFVYRVAREQGLTGWVLNDSRGVLIEVEGEGTALNRFLDDLREKLPPLASISRLDIMDIPPVGENDFVIRASSGEASKTAQISPDTFVCADCLRELFDPQDRRYRYPFINCTNCGPRFTIVTDIPYDRPNTTMAGFPMCAPCREEYDDPGNRRFHAQPNACPACGPRMTLLDADGREVAATDPVAEGIRLLRAGRIVAVKGLGGFHLAVDAANESAVADLRRRKERDEKPFAIMAADTAKAAALAAIGPAERQLLEGVERPIVLLRQKKGHGLSPLVAPRNNFFGLMLPYTPLHHLLLEGNFEALVMTSANVSDEPIVYEDGEALSRLHGIADYYLTHNRRIHTRTDDSIVRVMADRPVVLRRSRGYVPRGVFLPSEQPSVLAVGAELKNAVCLTQGNRAYLSQHIGDLKNLEVLDSLARNVEYFSAILELKPQIVAHDLHPDYLSTRYAEDLPGGMERVSVQHHHAHLASCLAEHRTTGEVIGIIFDGIGYGADGHIWGGEFLVGGYADCRRAGHFMNTPMPGGDAATREPYRMALSYLHQAYGEDLPLLPVLGRIPAQDRKLLVQMIEKGINAPLASSCGRLFDAVASMAGIRDRVNYEGQAALELEQAIDREDGGCYPFFLITEGESLVFDHRPLVRAVAEAVQAGDPTGLISARFHNSLVEMIRQVCVNLRLETRLERVVLSGGVFQNRYLTERSVRVLEGEGFKVLTHSLVPPNDGGLALGQAVIAGHRVAMGMG